MNYLIIQDSTTPSNEIPPNVVQTFTNEELQLLTKVLIEALGDRIDPKDDRLMIRMENERNAIATMIQLLQQWETKTQ